MNKEALIQRLREEAAHDLHHETGTLLLEAAEALAQPVQEHHEFPLRGLLASELKCWHRLTEDEQINLLAFVKNTTPPAAQQEPEYCDPSSVIYKVARIIMSDCGHSPNDQLLLDRIADRINRHIDVITPPAAQRKPMTDEQIDDAIWRSKKVEPSYEGWIKDQRRIWAKAIEAAHGIKENT